MARHRWRGALAAVAAACLSVACLAAALSTACGAGDRDGSGGDEPAAQPRRLVSLSPNVTEILFALGLEERVVGVDDYSPLPAGAGDEARLGGYLDPDLERLVSLAPDLVVLLVAQGELAAELEALGIEVLQVDNQDLEDVAESMVVVGERTGVGERGRELARSFRRDLAPRELPGPPRRVVISVGRTAGRTGEVLVAGPQSYLHELVARLGAENVFGDLERRYATVGAEELVARSPATVLELQPQRLDDGARRALAADWHGLLGADVQVVVLDGPEVLIPGPGLPRVYERLARALTRPEEG